MLSAAPIAQAFFCFLFSVLLSQATPQSATHQERGHITQDQLCCITTNAVDPTYPREARLAGIKGEVKLLLVIAEDNSIAELQAVSGDPFLLESTMKAVRQWRFMFGWAGGAPKKTEVPLTFTFKIEDPPKPAYLHLTGGKIVRADEVREFTDRVEYTVGHHTHDISANSVAYINRCVRARVIPLKEGDCVPSGGPSFDIRAIPLLPAVKTSHSSRAPC